MCCGKGCSGIKRYRNRVCVVEWVVGLHLRNSLCSEWRSCVLRGGYFKRFWSLLDVACFRENPADRHVASVVPAVVEVYVTWGSLSIRSAMSLQKTSHSHCYIAVYTFTLAVVELASVLWCMCNYMTIVWTWVVCVCSRLLMLH